MLIRDNIKLQEDAIASIRTKGLLGENMWKLHRGSDELVGPEERCTRRNLRSILKNDRKFYFWEGKGLRKMKHGKSGFIVLLALVFQCTPHLFVGRRRRKFAYDYGR